MSNKHKRCYMMVMVVPSDKKTLTVLHEWCHVTLMWEVFCIEGMGENACKA